MSERVRAIVVDIEGTTSSIDFVHQTLFPYARDRVRDFLDQRRSDSDVQQVLKEVSDLAGKKLNPDSAAEMLVRWIDEDRKVTPLKQLQGMIWKLGYEAGELKGHVYPDTPVSLRRWHTGGIKLFVYSSGSVAAQKLIFGNTDYGDLTPLFSGYFDTRIGGKREASAYQAITREIGLPGAQILFLSDVGEELDAASRAGMQTLQLLRDEKAIASENHQGVTDFSSILA